MKKAIVLGATGATGQVIITELLAKKVQVIAFARTETKLKELMKKHHYDQKLSYKVGDIFNYEEIVEAAEGSEIIFLCSGVSYQDMREKLFLFGESAMKATEILGAKIVVVDGIYVYGYQTGKGDENHPKQPHTKKGKLRVEYENLIFSDKWKNAKALIVRLPDYYGATSQGSYLQPTLEGMAAQKLSFFFGDLKTPREYVYLPDAGKMIVNIAEKDDSYGENWNIPGGGVISGQEIIQIAREITGNRKMVIPLTKNMVRCMGLINSFMREVVEIMYLTKEGFVLSGDKYEKRIGPIPTTSYRQGIKNTLHFYIQGKN
ncbi:NAD(P)H-binding protein [Alkalihalobacillus sp. 1P02AB]|uniref:NAD(P)H-binding protein n=1 Tax=Alkalihalobacillus sp. 1P02AB TaxID=3132260 RepID=UPI0039A4A77F